MKVTFRTFESGTGDCIFIIFNDELDGSRFHLMMDCNVLTKEIKHFISEELGEHIDLLIVTHIDSDHANGVTKLMRNPEFKDMHIGGILFNGFQPQTTKPLILDSRVVEKLIAVAELLPPTVDEAFHKTNGMDAACLITELNKHPQWKRVWRQEPILAGESIPLGEDAKWGNLRVLSPSQKAIDDILHEVKLEYAKRLSAAPPDEEFSDQDKYYELMLRLSELRKKPSISRKTNAVIVTKELMERYANEDVNEKEVTYANKASLAFCWEGGEEPKRILLMGDAVSSQVVKELNDISKNEIWFEAVKISHHGSKNNTSIEFNNKVNSAHYFITGGKKNKGPHIETIAKIAMKPMGDMSGRRELHYNHQEGISLWDDLQEEQALNLLNEKHLYLKKDNIHEFEY